MGDTYIFNMAAIQRGPSPKVVDSKQKVICIVFLRCALYRIDSRPSDEGAVSCIVTRERFLAFFGHCSRPSPESYTKILRSDEGGFLRDDCVLTRMVS